MEGWKSSRSFKIHGSTILLNFNGIIVQISLFFIVLLIITAIIGYFLRFVVVFGSILAHELGHALIVFLIGNKIYVFKVLPAGLNIEVEEAQIRWKRILVYFGGPLTNLMVFVFVILFSYFANINTYELRFLLIANIYLALFNLLPLLPMDGGCILREILSIRIGLVKASKQTRLITGIMLTFICTIGILQLIKSNYNISLMLIGTYIFFYLITKKTEAAIMNVKQIIFRRTRFLKKGVYAARELVALKSMSMTEIIKNMDFDRFHIVHVLDDDLKIVRTFTEQQIIDALLACEGDMTFERLLV